MNQIDIAQLVVKSSIRMILPDFDKCQYTRSVNVEGSESFRACNETDPEYVVVIKSVKQNVIGALLVCEHCKDEIVSRMKATTDVVIAKRIEF